MNKYIIYFFVLANMAFMGCEDNFLDRKLDTNYTKEQVFSSYTTMRDFGIGIYTFLPQGFNRIDGAMLAAATDDAVHSGIGTDILSLTNGSWGPFNNPDDHWAHFYAGIRKTNQFLENTVNYESIVYRDTITDEGKQSYFNQVNDLKWLRAEARFLRAFFYFELIKRYGDVPIITQVISPDDIPAVKRNSYQECVVFITSEIDALEGELRDTWSGFENDSKIGRATWGAALALKARTLLYAASLLNNPENDTEKWKKAAEAAHDVILLNQYSLADNYRNLFRSVTSNEFILARRYAADNNLERSNYPVGFEGAVGGANPTQNLVDAYQTANGLPIDEDLSYDPQNPYEGRDPRLNMTIIVNDSEYKGRKVEIWEGGKDSPNQPRGTRTGYYLKKYADEGLDLLQDKTSAHTWIYFRYAEILLNYAEAMNEAYGPDDNAGFTLTAREAINLVRSRPGVNMPGVTDVTKENFRNQVRNERRIELAFEEHRFWDVRRWKTGSETLGSPVYGVKCKKVNESFAYEYPETPVEKRVFEDRMYRYPLPMEEIIKTSGKLVQNKGW